MSNNTPYLEQNDRGVWEIRWTDQRRSMRKSTRTPIYDDAVQQLAKFLAERHDRKRVEALTVNKVLDDYDSEHVENKVVDKRRQRDVLNNLRPFFGHMIVADIKPSDAKLYERKRGEGVVGSRVAKSPGTIRRELNALVAAINHAVRAKRMKAAEVPYIPLPTPPAEKDLWLNEEELDQLLDAADDENERYPEGDRGWLFVHIAAGTASRRRAIESLRWPQVDLAARLIHFRPQGSVQTNKRRVAVPISDDLLPVLQRARLAATSDYVLHKNSSAVRRFEAVCQRAWEMTANDKFLEITPHTLRHTWATLAARAGVPLFEIAGVLGDTIATCQKNYLHHCPDHLRSAVNARARSGARGVDLRVIPGGRDPTDLA